MDFRPEYLCSGLASVAPFLCVGRVNGDGDGEGRALAGLALDGDRAAVSLDNRVGDGEAEARPLAHGLRREERVEDAREVFGRDAVARVAYLDDRRRALAPRLDADLAALSDRVRGVDEEVEPDLIQLPGEAVDEREFAVVARERDVDVAELAREQSQGRVESLVDVHLLEFGLLDPREGAKVP